MERKGSEPRLQGREAMENYWDREIPGAGPVWWRINDQRSESGLPGKIRRLLDRLVEHRNVNRSCEKKGAADAHQVQQKLFLSFFFEFLSDIDWG